MTESERIKKNKKGELPIGEKTIIRVSNIQNAEKALEKCKQIVLTLLSNQSLDKNDPKWGELLPKEIVHLIDGFTEEDCMNDEYLFDTPYLIGNWKRLKEWEWYSSKRTESGFEIITTNSFSPRFQWFIHYQGIPYSKIWVMDDRRGHYSIDVIKDITTYK